MMVGNDLTALIGVVKELDTAEPTSRKNGDFPVGSFFGSGLTVPGNR